MVSIFDVIRRTENGPAITERDFDIEMVFKKTKELVAKHGLKYDRNELITQNPEMADACFKAGFELAVESGIFCIDTSRMIKFTEDELKYALKTAPKSLTLGWGKDQRVIKAKEYGIPNRPFIWGGFSGSPLSEELYRQSIRSYIKEPLVDCLGHGSIPMVDGIEVRTGSPMEIRAARQELLYVREGLAREGRPGMPFVAGESSTTVLGDLAIMNPSYMPPNNTHFVSTLNELKTDYTDLSKVMSAYEYGVHNINLIDAIIGGYAGGPEGAAVVTVAAFIMGLIVNRASISLCHPAHNKWISTSPPESIWAENIVGQAFSRNSPLITIGDVWTSAGTGTADILLEIAAITITKTLTGNHPHGVGATNGIYPHGSGMDVRWMGEVAHATFDQNISLERGNEIVCELVSRYEGKFENPDLGLPYNEVYDVETATPKDWWLEIYSESKKMFAKDFGLYL